MSGDKLSLDGSVRKVFVVGLPKTGLTSLLHALTQLGYKTHGTNKKGLKALLRGDLETVDRYFQEYEAFLDWPVPLLYRRLFESYGKDAKYILTLRKSPETWVESLKRHSLRDSSDQDVVSQAVRLSLASWFREGARGLLQDLQSGGARLFR